jgi:UDP-glucose 4-epimerase
MEILVTGGAGFIGAHTVLSLVENGFEPILVDNFSNSVPEVLPILKQLSGKDLYFYNIDCTNKIGFEDVFVKHPNIAGVIHFAAYKAVGESVAEPLKYYHNNVYSLMILLELMQKYGVKNLVFSSSCTVYGEPDTLPVTEMTPQKPANSPYGYTKQVCEKMIVDFQYPNQKSLNAILLRYFNPIGAHPSGKIGELPLGVPNNLLPYIMQTAASIREELTIHGNDYSTPDGTCIRDYIHVCDLAEAHVKALEKLNLKHFKTPEIYNVGVGKGVSVKEAVDTFEEVNQVKVNHKFGPRRPGDVEKIYADNSKIVNELNWQPKYTLADACKHSWLWQNNLKSL